MTNASGKMKIKSISLISVYSLNVWSMGCKCLVFFFKNSDLIEHLFCQAPSHCRYKGGYGIISLFKLFRICLDSRQDLCELRSLTAPAFLFLPSPSGLTGPSPQTTSISPGLYEFFSSVSTTRISYKCPKPMWQGGRLSWEGSQGTWSQF